MLLPDLKSVVLKAREQRRHTAWDRCVDSEFVDAGHFDGYTSMVVSLSDLEFIFRFVVPRALCVVVELRFINQQSHCIYKQAAG